MLVERLEFLEFFAQQCYRQLMWSIVSGGFVSISCVHIIQSTTSIIVKFVVRNKLYP